MCVSTVYTPILRSRLAAPEETYFFMMNALLYSRLECGYPTNHEFFDEDVNVYLAGLLTSRIGRDPAGRDPGLALADGALAEAALADADLRRRYELYRWAADTLLVALGIFRNARGRRPVSAPRIALPDRVYVGRGQVYYAIARSYAAALHRRDTGIAVVLGKLSRGFERYLSVLSYLGGEYLGIVKGISDGEIYHLERSAAASGPRPGLAEAYDRFLDCYSSFRREPTASGKLSLAEAAGSLRALDPSFTFDVESLERVISP